VKIQTIKTDWIFNDKELGIGFLKELIRQRHFDLFETDYIKILIHYLYRQFSGKIRTRLLPLYCLHMASILIYIATIENLRSEAYKISFKNINDSEIGSVEFADGITSDVLTIANHINKYVKIKNIFCIFIMSINIVNVYFFTNQTRHLGKMALTRVWSIVDFAIIILNTCICSGLLDDSFDSQAHNYAKLIPTDILRVLETILILFMAFKSLYYL